MGSFGIKRRSDSSGARRAGASRRRWFGFVWHRALCGLVRRPRAGAPWCRQFGFVGIAPRADSFGARRARASRRWWFGFVWHPASSGLVRRRAYRRCVAALVWVRLASSVARTRSAAGAPRLAAPVARVRSASWSHALRPCASSTRFEYIGRRRSPASWRSRGSGSLGRARCETDARAAGAVWPVGTSGPRELASCVGCGLPLALRTLSRAAARLGAALAHADVLGWSPADRGRTRCEPVPARRDNLLQHRNECNLGRPRAPLTKSQLLVRHWLRGSMGPSESVPRPAGLGIRGRRGVRRCCSPRRFGWPAGAMCPAWTAACTA